MKKIIFLSPIDPISIQKVKNFSKNTLILKNESRIYNIKQKFKVEVLIVKSFSLKTEILKKFENLKIIIKHGIGIDNIDLKYCQENKIKIFNTKHASPNSVVEQNIFMIMGLYKNYNFYLNLIKNIEMSKIQKFRNNLVLKKNLELINKKILIIGYGKIGKLLAKKCHLIGLNVSICNRSIKKIKSKNYKKFQFDKLKMHVHKFDIISLNLSLNKDTHQFFDRKLFSRMKKNSIIINCARLELFNLNDFYRAIKKKNLIGAGIDFVNPQLMFLQKKYNLILTPHVSSYTQNSLQSRGLEVVRIINNFLKNGS